MWSYTLAVDGMACGMCESHVNNVIRQNFAVKKVTSSHKKGQTVILSETELDEAALRGAVEQTGYRVTAIEKAPRQKARPVWPLNEITALPGGVGNVWREHGETGRF